jgi:hypothetical protein
MEAVLERQFEGSTSTYTERSTDLPIAALPDERVQRIAEAVAAAGAVGDTVSWHTKLLAKALLQFVDRFGLGSPELTVEPSGEISFEWYKDRQHLVVLTVDDRRLKWLLMTGQARATSGAQAFESAIPQQVLAAINTLI